MRRSHLVLGIVLCTGCSAILGFKDGTLSAGKAGDLCNVRNGDAERTSCATGFACFAGRCYENCPAAGCPARTRCLPSDDAYEGFGGPSSSIPTQKQACVPFDKTRCTGGGKDSQPVCANLPNTECQDGSCRVRCSVNEAQGAGPSGAPPSCLANEMCVPLAEFTSDGFCFAPGETDAAVATAKGQELGTFGKSSNFGSIVPLGNSVYWAHEGVVQICEKREQGCLVGALLQGAAPQFGTLIRHASDRLAWWEGDNSVRSCKPSGSSCSDMQDLSGSRNGGYQGRISTPFGGESPAVFWLESGSGSSVSLVGRLDADAGAPSVVGSFTLAPTGNVSLASHDQYRHLVLSGGDLWGVRYGKTPQKVFSNTGGAPSTPTVITMRPSGGGDRAIWMSSQMTGGTLLRQCSLGDGDAVCNIETVVSLYVSPNGATLTALATARSTIYWAERLQSGSTVIRSCVPSVSGPCAATDIERGLGEVQTMSYDEGYLYYSMLRNSDHSLALRRVVAPP